MKTLAAKIMKKENHREVGWYTVSDLSLGTISTSGLRVRGWESG